MRICRTPAPTHASSEQPDRHTERRNTGLPAFFLALAPSSGPLRRDGFARDLVHFAIPVGVVVACAVAGTYLVARGPLDRSVADARTVATVVTIVLGLAVVIPVERDAEDGRVRWWVWEIAAAAIGIAVAGVSLAPLRSFFEVTSPARSDWLVIAVAGLGGGMAAGLVGRRAGSRAQTADP